jgi:DNA-binding NarL/FixJ family response regulator
VPRPVGAGVVGQLVREEINPRILVVDDDPAMRMTIVGLLDACGIRVVAAGPDGGHGIDLARRVQPDVLLMEMPQPVAVGLVVIKELRRLVPRALVMLLTADDTPWTHDRAKEAGCAEVLVKGINPTRLAAIIRRAWRQASCDQTGQAARS